MPSQLLLARAGSGKTETALARLLETKRANRLAKVWVLLSTERQIADFRHRLSGVLFNIEFFTFYPLYNRLLTLGGTPQRCLDDTARYGLLREILRGLPLDVYREIATKPGFIRVVADLIYELKQNLITPQAFELAAGNAKERELARIYDAYQNMLREHHLVDREGEGWRALDVLANKPAVAADVDLLIVDGYDQFNLLQARLIAQLGRRVGETLITLTTVEGREATLGRRFEDARRRLHATHDASQLTEVRHLPPAPDQADHGLQHLADHLLLPKPQIYPTATEAIRLLEAPDPVAEAALVLRRVKRLLLDGTPPEQVLIAVRDWSTYADAFGTAARAYGVPVAINYGEPLKANPAITALLNVLALPKLNFRRRELLDTLRSPYFRVPGLDEPAVNLLERAANEFMVFAGRAEWLQAIDLLIAPETDITPDDDDDDGGPAAGITAERAAELQAALTAFFAALTPPQTKDVRVLVGWLEALIGQDAPDPDDDPVDAPPVPAYTLDMVTSIRHNPDDRFTALVERDLAALGALKLILRAQLSAAALFGALQFAPVDYSADTFLRDLSAAVDQAVFRRGAKRDGRVLITSVSDARGLPHAYVFVPGMAEGLFPRPIPEDPLLLDSERARLQTDGLDLPTQAERADDEGLFYELIGLARQALCLSRPVYKNGEAWAESHLYRAVQAVFPHVEPEVIRLGAPLPADEVGTRSEAAVAATASPALRRWLAQADPAFWAQIELGLLIERGRLSRQPYDRYVGRLADETLIRRVADWLSPETHVWSATQLAEFGVCNFRFFARRLLNLEPLETPEEGMDARQLGTLQHEILEKTYAEFKACGLPIAPEHVDTALEILEHAAESVFPGAPKRLRFRPSARWADEQQVILRRLRQFVKFDFSEKHPIRKEFPGERQSHAFERQFGFREEARLDLGGEELRLRGVIDRMDRIGDRLVIIDYKSGSTKIPSSEIEQGRNFQMLVYLAAAQALVGADQVAGGAFFHISDRSVSGALTPDDPVLDAGKTHIRRLLRDGRAGRFHARANGMDSGQCTSYCDFAQFCRVHVTNQDKDADA
ncbi:MAG: PD-(D/E)XK nuclease family protein [Anaerolineae bacterium]|nr:PD-(D/E)XK nuclease family protein [Anaerolineae bacterium]